MAAVKATVAAGAPGALGCGEAGGLVRSKVGHPVYQMGCLDPVRYLSRKERANRQVDVSRNALRKDVYDFASATRNAVHLMYLPVVRAHNANSSPVNAYPLVGHDTRPG